MCSWEKKCVWSRKNTDKVCQWENLNDDHVVGGGHHGTENLSLHLLLFEREEWTYKWMENYYYSVFSLYLSSLSFLTHSDSVLMVLRPLSFPTSFNGIWLLGNKHRCTTYKALNRYISHHYISWKQSSKNTHNNWHTYLPKQAMLRTDARCYSTYSVFPGRWAVFSINGPFCLQSWSTQGCHTREKQPSPN